MDSRTKSDLQRLTKKRTTIAPLGNASTPDTIPAQTGTGSPGGVSVASSAGIAGPLTETDYATRTWHAPQVVTSTDGIWAWVFDYPQQINLTDGNANALPLILDAP